MKFLLITGLAMVCFGAAANADFKLPDISESAKSDYVEAIELAATAEGVTCKPAGYIVSNLSIPDILSTFLRISVYIDTTPGSDTPLMLEGSQAVGLKVTLLIDATPDLKSIRRITYRRLKSERVNNGTLLAPKIDSEEQVVDTATCLPKTTN